MSVIFSVDPRMIIGPASILGSLYFLYVCVADAQTLLNYWRQHNTKTKMKKNCLVKNTFWRFYSFSKSSKRQDHFLNKKDQKTLFRNSFIHTSDSIYSDVHLK